ncbi:MAG: hypothetical protein ABEK50_07090 [bacterium]
MRLSTVDEKYGEIYEYFESKRQNQEFTVFNDAFHEDGKNDQKIPRAGGAEGLKQYLESYVTEDGWRRCLTYLRQQKDDSERISIPSEIKKQLDERKKSDDTYGDVIKRLLDE